MSKILYPLIAVVGIAGASGAAYWYQNKSNAPVVDASQATAGVPSQGGTSSVSAPAPATGASAAAGPARPAGVEVA